ncbi:MAG: sulfatase-like hydrolase/transferase, partial [Armatimonadota bacterium]|nr:sulfatase-like hydrolase/transferase [Armatimonadota bacterium]
SGRGSWFARGFDFYSGFLYKPFSDQSEQLTSRALGFIEDYKEKPFLLYIHLWDPHTPYGPPPPYDTMHYQPADHPSGEPTLAEVKALAPEYYEAFLDDMKLRVPDDYAYVVAQYDGEISYVDAQIGRIVAYLKSCGLWDNTILILMSDHGECFGEGDVYFDHHGLYDAVLRVALICRTPGIAPARYAAMISTEDILPTLIECCDWEQPPYPLTGQSFLEIWRGDRTSGRNIIIGVESTRQASLCLRTDKWKLIQPIVHDRRGKPIRHIYGQPRDPRLLLFDLENDPQERHDVSERFPQVRDELAQQLAAWRADEVARRGGDDPVLEGLSLAYDDFMARLTSRRLWG